MSISFDAPGADYGYEPADGRNATNKPDPYGYEPADPMAGRSLAKTGGRPTAGSISGPNGVKLGSGLRIIPNNIFNIEQQLQDQQAGNVSIDTKVEAAPAPTVSATAAARKKNRGVRSVFQRAPGLGGF